MIRDEDMILLFCDPVVDRMLIGNIRPRTRRQQCKPAITNHGAGIQYSAGGGHWSFSCDRFRINQDDVKALLAAGDGGTMQGSLELKFSPKKRSKISWQINLT